MSQNLVMSRESLLQHESFIRAVVRDLLRDEASVQDVVQETWLRALVRPPRVASSLRPWLARVATNLARDSHRRASRRAVREERVARPETVESVDATFERLTAQREIVDEVLALAEPYKSVVTFYYYHDLSAAQIAERLGRSPATVRSQLSRAHELLRAALDRRFESGRSAWAGLALPLAPGAPLSESLAHILTTSSGKLFAVALAASLTLMSAIWLAGSQAPALEPGSNESVQLALSPAAALAPPATAPAALPARTVRQPVSTREALTVAAPAVPVQEDLELRSPEQLLALVVQLQRAIKRRVLTPDESFVAANAGLLALPGTGLCRILTGKGATSDFESRVSLRGGATYYSFGRQEHSYNSRPDLSFRDGRFSSGFAGIDMGLLADIGDVPLLMLPDDAVGIEGWVPAEKRDSLAPLWQPIAMKDAAHDSAFRVRVQELARGIMPEGLGSTYLVRSFLTNEFDSLIAFRPLAIDEAGCTLAWRILKTWPAPGGKQGGFMSMFDPSAIPTGPDWIGELPVEALTDLLQLVRKLANEKLLVVPEFLQQRYADAVGSDSNSFANRVGFARILYRGKWDPLFGERGGAAYYSFVSRSNSFDSQPQIGLERKALIARDRGLLLDLGELSFDKLGAAMAGAAPEHLSAREREAWQFLGRVRATITETDDSPRRSLSDEDRQRAKELGLKSSRVPATVGHTYLLRSVASDDFDQLVIFTVIGGDPTGLSLAWRILRDWPVEQPPGR